MVLQKLDNFVVKDYKITYISDKMHKNLIKSSYLAKPFYFFSKITDI